MLAGFGQSSIVVLLVAIVALDVAFQSAMVLSQARHLSIDPEARSAINTAFVTCNFVAAPLGSALAGVLWPAGGWHAVMTGGVSVLSVALLLWFATRRTLGVASPAGRVHG